MNTIDLKNVDQVKVFKAERLAGTLSRTQNGAVFEYDQNYLAQAALDPNLAIAYKLPTTTKRHLCAGYNLHPFFAGLLPEGLRLEALLSKVKSSKDDLFTILLASSPDVIGDVWISDDGEIPKKSNEVLKLESILFEDLFQKSIVAQGKEASYNDITIPGVQNKISARMISFPVTIKSRRHDYILKLNPKDLPNLVENEFFFMNLARECGLEVAPVKLVRDKAKNAGLLVERFDRIYDKSSKSFCRIHQEDSCQFLNRYPADKYRVTAAEIANGIVELSTAALIEVLELLQLVAFSYVIGNGDLHGKNISLLTEPHSGRVKLSPAYDLLSTVPYGDMRMAIQFEGRDDNLKRADFINFGKRFGVRPKIIDEMLNRIVLGVNSAIDRVVEIGLPTKRTKQLRDVIAKRVGDISR